MALNIAVWCRAFGKVYKPLSWHYNYPISPCFPCCWGRSMSVPWHFRPSIRAVEYRNRSVRLLAWSRIVSPYAPCRWHAAMLSVSLPAVLRYFLVRVPLWGHRQYFCSGYIKPCMRGLWMVFCHQAIVWATPTRVWVAVHTSTTRVVRRWCCSIRRLWYHHWQKPWWYRQLFWCHIVPGMATRVRVHINISSVLFCYVGYLPRGNILSCGQC